MFLFLKNPTHKVHLDDWQRRQWWRENFLVKEASDGQENIFYNFYFTTHHLKIIFYMFLDFFSTLNHENTRDYHNESKPLKNNTLLVLELRTVSYSNQSRAHISWITTKSIYL